MTKTEALEEIKRDIACSRREQRLTTGEDNAYERGYTAALQYALSILGRLS